FDALYLRCQFLFLSSSQCQQSSAGDGDGPVLPRGGGGGADDAPDQRRRPGLGGAFAGAQGADRGGSHGQLPPVQTPVPGVGGPGAQAVPEPGPPVGKPVSPATHSERPFAFTQVVTQTPGPGPDPNPAFVPAFAGPY